MTTLNNEVSELTTGLHHLMDASYPYGVKMPVAPGSHIHQIVPPAGHWSHSGAAETQTETHLRPDGDESSCLLSCSPISTEPAGLVFQFVQVHLRNRGRTALTPPCVCLSIHVARPSSWILPGFRIIVIRCSRAPPSTLWPICHRTHQSGVPPWKPVDCVHRYVLIYWRTNDTCFTVHTRNRIDVKYFIALHFLFRIPLNISSCMVS